MELSQLSVVAHSIGNKVVKDEDLQGAIFDCDGTLIDSMSMWLPCWYHACEKFDLELSEQRFWELCGTPIHDMVIALYHDKHHQSPSEELIEEFLNEKRIFHAKLESERGPPPAIECVVALVHGYKAKGIKVAIASSGVREIVESHCEHAGILHLFDKVVVAAEVAHGKPAPDVYLKAAEMLGADPTKCCAFEDAELGMLSAWRAQMQVVDVRGFEGYPLSEGLAFAMAEQRESRTWLISDGGES